MSSEISQLCLEALSPLAEQCAKSQDKDTPLFIATRHFLKVHPSPKHFEQSGLFLFGDLVFRCKVNKMVLGFFFCLRVQLVFDMLVLQKHNMEMTVAAGEAFYTLVCLHQVKKTTQQNPNVFILITLTRSFMDAAAQLSLLRWCLSPSGAEPLS